MTCVGDAAFAGPNGHPAEGIEHRHLSHLGFGVVEIPENNFAVIAGLHTGGLLASRQTLIAERALLDDALGTGRVVRIHSTLEVLPRIGPIETARAIGAGRHAEAAADAAEAGGAGESAAAVGPDGSIGIGAPIQGTIVSINVDVDDQVIKGQQIAVVARKADGGEVRFDTTCRADSPVEVDYYRNGGILHTVLRNMLRS